jgi:hypothetical protein
MSETQYKVTGTFKAVDEAGNEHTITEYTLFRHTTTSDMADGVGGDVKEYKLGTNSPVNQISETEFEIVSSGTRLYKSS